MKQSDQNRLSMWCAVDRIIADYSGVWNGHEPFSKASGLLTDAIERARAALDAQSGTSTGISTDRTSLKNDAISQTLALAKCAKVYAMDTGNNELHAAVAHSATTLTLLPHHERAAQLRTIIAAVRGVGVALENFGVSAKDCDEALAAVVAMEQAQTFVRLSITGKKAVTLTVPEIMNMGREALTRLDNLIHLFGAAHPEFVSAYKAARAVAHVGSRHREDPPPSTEAA